ATELAKARPRTWSRRCLAASRTTAIPSTLTRAPSVGRARAKGTWRAARCTMWVTACSATRRWKASASVTSQGTSGTFCSSSVSMSRQRCVSADRSVATTAVPAPVRRLTVHDPMQPRAPVTRKRSGRTVSLPKSAPKIDRHALGLREALQHPVKRELAPDSALFEATVGLARELAHPLVDLHPARLDRVGGAQRPGHVAAPDIPSQAVVAVIRHAHRFLLVTPGDDDQHRAEDLFPGDPPFVLHTGKDGGLDVVALGQRPIDGWHATDGNARPLLVEAVSDVRADAVELLPIDDAAH